MSPSESRYAFDRQALSKTEIPSEISVAFSISAFEGYSTSVVVFTVFVRYMEEGLGKARFRALPSPSVSASSCASEMGILFAEIYSFLVPSHLATWPIAVYSKRF